MGAVRCVMDEDDQVLFREEEIKARWKMYCEGMSNNGVSDVVGNLNLRGHEANRVLMQRIRESKLKEALKKMKARKAVCPIKV